MPTIVDAVDFDEALSRVDVDQLMERVDVNALLERVDVDALLQRVDMNALLQRVDVNALVQRVNANALLDTVDVNAIAGRIEFGAVATRSTGRLLISLLDALRRLVVGIDVLARRFIFRLTRRPPELLAAGPPLLVDPDHEAQDGQVTGRYAGPVSRLIAFGLDVWIILVTYAIGASVFSYIWSLITGHTFARGGGSDPWWTVALLVWGFIYMWVGMAVAGRSVGKVIVGLRVVATDGSPITERQSFFRVLAMPLSFILAGIGLIMGLFSPRHRTLHDRMARTCVVYDWGDRPAEMPAPLSHWLTQRGVNAKLVGDPTPGPGGSSTST